MTEFNWLSPHELTREQIKAVMKVEECDAQEAQEWYRRYYHTQHPGARRLLLERYLDGFAIARLRGGR